MATGPWTQVEDDALRELIPQGVSQTEIGRRLERSRGAVANRAAKLGIFSDRTDTVKATEAKVIDAKARRATLEVRMLERAAKILDRLDADTFRTVLKAEMGAEEIREVDTPLPRDERDLMNAAQIALTSALKVAAHDADTGAAEASSAAGDILAAIKAAAAELGDS